MTIVLGILIYHIWSLSEEVFCNCARIGIADFFAYILFFPVLWLASENFIEVYLIEIMYKNEDAVWEINKKMAESIIKNPGSGIVTVLIVSRF